MLKWCGANCVRPIYAQYNGFRAKRVYAYAMSKTDAAIIGIFVVVVGGLIFAIKWHPIVVQDTPISVPASDSQMSPDDSTIVPAPVGHKDVKG